MFLKGNCIKTLLLPLTGNMLSFQIFLIIGANVVAPTTTTTTTTNAATENINVKLLSTTAITSKCNDSNSDACNTNRNIDDEAFVQFLKYVSQEQSFTTIVILTNWQYATATTTTTTTSATMKKKRNLKSTWQHTDYCVNLQYYMEQHFKMPVLLLQAQQADYTLHKKFNSEFITVICLPPPTTIPPQQQFIAKVTQNHLLQALSKNLLYLRRNRVIFRLAFNSHDGSEYLQNIEYIFKYCHMEQIINAIIVTYRFPYNDTFYYSYDKFPEFKVRKHKWLVKAENDNVDEEQKLFPNKLRNLKGHKIVTLPDQIEPRSVVYYNAEGKQKIGGYLGHFIDFLIQGLNATLVQAYEVKPGISIFYSDILKLTRNHTIDIPVSLTGPINGTDFSEFSYPFEIANWCIMLPLELELSMGEIFSAVLNQYFLVNVLLVIICFTFLMLIVFKRSSGFLFRLNLVDILLNDKALRAVLGQGFPMPTEKLDYFVVYVILLLSITGIVCVTLYSVFLGSFMTSPPKMPPIRSFAQLEKSGIKLFISQREYELIYPSDYDQYSKLFKIEPSFDEFVRMRNTLNTSYAYPLPSSRWPVIATQQSFFSRKLFRYANDVCFNRYLHFYLLLPMHSIYREPIHWFTLKAYSSGLFYYWFESSFYELVSLGHMSFTDITEPRRLKPLDFKDLNIIFCCFCIASMASVLVFLGEIFLNKFFILERCASRVLRVFIERI